MGLNEKATSTFFGVALVSAFVSTFFISPVDVIKTRVMETRIKGQTGVQTLYLMLRNEGILSIYKGFNTSFCRLASQ
jgi:hypothetical protein